MTGYTCPMHPDQTSPNPGRCPICRMHLMPTGAAAAGACCSTKSPEHGG